MSLQQISSFQKKLVRKISNGQRILSIYLTLGFPSLDQFRKIAHEIAIHGADIIEIGIPFSDPMADGPIIQHSSKIALDAGVVPQDAWPIIKELKQTTDVDIAIMTYGNIPLQYRYDEFIRMCKKSGVDALILPDIPPEHYPVEFEILDSVFLVPPNADESRINYLTSQSSGFIYVMSRLGITGLGAESDHRTRQVYKQISSIEPKLPKLQGFGINSRKAVRESIDAGADGVIIGSEILRIISETGNMETVVNFIQDIREELDT
jgi:tryptophan synthase alpha chain